jgi:hypothetical protein
MYWKELVKELDDIVQYWTIYCCSLLLDFLVAIGSRIDQSKFTKLHDTVHNKSYTGIGCPGKNKISAREHVSFLLLLPLVSEVP